MRARNLRTRRETQLDAKTPGAIDPREGAERERETGSVRRGGRGGVIVRETEWCHTSTSRRLPAPRIDTIFVVCWRSIVVSKGRCSGVRPTPLEEAEGGVAFR